MCTRERPALYARAYAYPKKVRVDLALDATDQLLAIDPDDPYFLELKGQVLLESGRPEESLEPLRRAPSRTNFSALISRLLLSRLHLFVCAPTERCRSRGAPSQKKKKITYILTSIMRIFLTIYLHY